MSALIVGLTGSLASGKSTVGALFEKWGAVRIDADELARIAVEPGSDAFLRIRARFGEDVIADDGTLDRSAIRRIVFGDAGARTFLEATVHPEVMRLRSARHEAAIRAGAMLIVDEVPLLFETGLDAFTDVTVVVDAPIAARRERALAARGWTVAEFEAIESSQLDPSRKRGRADHVILNEGSLDELEARARLVWSRLADHGAVDRSQPSA